MAHLGPENTPGIHGEPANRSTIVQTKYLSHFKPQPHLDVPVSESMVII